MSYRRTTQRRYGMRERTWLRRTNFIPRPTRAAPDAPRCARCLDTGTYPVGPFNEDGGRQQAVCHCPAGKEWKP